jgi:hypothetical protein
MTDVDEVITNSAELQDHIDDYEHPFKIKIDDGHGVDIVSEFRELDGVDLEYNDFKQWEISPPSKKNEKLPANPDASSQEQDGELAESTRQLKLFIIVLILILIISWSWFFWQLHTMLIKKNSGFLTLLGLFLTVISSLLSSHYLQ